MKQLSEKYHFQLQLSHAAVTLQLAIEVTKTGTNR